MALTVSTASATVFGWGDGTFNQTSIPEDFIGARAVAAGYWHSIAIDRAGAVVAWGLNEDGQAAVPSGLSNAVAVSGGRDHSLALRRDGVVVAWGSNAHGQTNVPPEVAGVAQISAGGFHNLALLSNGTVRAWGYAFYGQIAVPGDLTNVAAVAAGNAFSLALRSNGTIRAWGDNFYGQTDVPADLTNAITIAAGFAHALALRDDGTVVMWGDTSQGQEAVPDGLDHVIAIAAGGMHSLALRDDGQIVGWGLNDKQQTSPPWNVTRPMAVAAGFEHSLALGDDAVAIVAEPDDVVAEAGEWRSVELTAEGQWPSYAWFFNGNPIPNSDTNRIAFKGLTTDHAGHYFCIVTNEISAATSRVATVTVIVPGSTGVPVIRADPVSRTVFPGQSVTFTVAVTGAVPLMHRWLHDGTPLAGATDSNLTISSVQAEHTGAYRAIVTNAVGAVTSSTATLSLYLPPTFVSHPQGVYTTAGSRVEFRCNATGTAPIGYLWRFNGAPVSGASNTLVRSSVTLDQAGEYFAVATNAGGAATSQVAVLEVVESPAQLAPSITGEPADRGIPIGGTAAFAVQVSGAAPLVYRWRFNGDAIAGATGNAHEVQSAQPADAGFYSAIVTNGHGAVTSRLASLSFVFPPTITVQPQGGNVPFGSRVELSLSATGTPSMACAWLRDGVSAGGGPVDVPLVIASATLGHAGGYRAIVTNGVGAATSQVAVLTVYTNGLSIVPCSILSGESTGRFVRLTFALEAGCNYRVQSSTNMVDWDDVTNFLSSSATADFLGQSDTNMALRFYRVVSP
jgi:alpha-tubulin suppressor-like RCC1 family protein